MIDVLGALMGIDMQGFSRPEGSDEVPPGFNASSSTPPTYSPPTTSSSTPKPAAPPPPTEDVEMEDDDDEEAQAKKQAEAAKKTGSEAYKRRDFDEAARSFQKAWDLWPKDITFLTNLGGTFRQSEYSKSDPTSLPAVYFEQGDYDKSIETCEKAAEEGRSVCICSPVTVLILILHIQLRADYKLVAKAYGRIGSAYQKKSDLTSAIKYYQKSLTEHRTPDVLNKLREVERIKAETDRKAYIDPEKSAAAREEGNAQFKNGAYADAVKSYTESIKRDPSDAKGYNNRAAAYLKLLAFPEALKDAEEAIKVDPTFSRSYLFVFSSSLLNGRFPL